MLRIWKNLLSKIEQNSTLGLQLFLLGRFAGMLLVSVLLAKSHRWLTTPLTVSEIGQFELFVFLSGLLSFFWVNAFVKAILSFSDVNKPDVLKNQIVQVFYLFVALSVTVGLIALALYFTGLFYAGTGIIIMVGSVLYVLFWTPSMLLEYFFVLRKQQLPLIYSALLTPFFMIISVVSGLAITRSAEGAIAGMVFYSLLRAVATFVILTRKNIPKLDPVWIKRYAIFSVPLIVSGLIAESGMYVDGIIVTALFDEKAFALFRYGARELPITTILATGLGNAMVPILAANPSSAETIIQLRQKSRRLLLLMVPLSIFLMLSSQWLYIHVFNPDFIESAIIFDIYLLLVLPRLLFPQTIILGMKHNNILVPIAVCEIVSNIALSVWWGTIWGIAGIAMGTFVSFVIEKILLISYVSRKIGIPPRDYIPMRLFLMLSILLFLVFAAKHFGVDFLSFP